MRKIVPLLLLGIGGFLLIAGVVAATWAPGKVNRTPLNVDSTTRLAGTVSKLNPATGKLVTNPVKVESVTKSDNNASTGSTIAFTNSTCVVLDVDDAPGCVDGKDPRLVTASTDVFAASRTSALAVSSAKLPSTAVKHEGLTNKWPFDAAKRTYPYWDGVVGRSVDAKFDREQSIDGFDTYVYSVDVEAAPIQIAQGVPGTYDDAKEIAVDPRTGAIIKQTERQVRTLDAGDVKALDLRIAFTDAQVKKNVDDARTNVKSIDLVTRTIPLVGIIGGAILILLGLLLALRARRVAHAHR